MLRGTQDGIPNTHYTADGAIIFKHACTLAVKGVVSKQLGSPYKSGRVDHWLKIKNPAAGRQYDARRKRIGVPSGKGDRAPRFINRVISEEYTHGQSS